MEKEITFDLFNPEYTYLHRAGIAGLYMTRKSFNKNNICNSMLSWELTDEKIKLYINSTEKESLIWLFNNSFKICDYGLIDFPGYANNTHIEKYLFHDFILHTFYGQGKGGGGKLSSIKKSINVEINDEVINLNYNPVIRLNHLYKIEEK